MSFIVVQKPSNPTYINPLNAELNPICHLLALLEGATIVDVSGLRVNLLEPTGYVIRHQVKHSRILHSAHTAFMCFIFISEQMATFAPYKIN